MSGFDHPAFGPYLDLLALLGGRPGLDALNNIAEQMNARHAHSGKPLRFAASSKPSSAAQYEQSIATTGSVPTRENNLHDFLNALVWLRFPRLKSALNLRHCQALEEQPEEHQQRGKLRDRLTLMDESGMLVISPKMDLLELLRGKCWVELFWNMRTEVVQHMRFIVIGHGLLEKCLAPFPGMTAKCLFLQTSETGMTGFDELAASMTRNAVAPELPPLPVQGIPGWDDNESQAYYQNTEIFRVGRTPPPAL